MSFWGLSTAGKEAKGFPREYGAWNWQQYKDWLGKSGQFGARAQPATEQAYQYWGTRAETGLPSPGEIRHTGAQIMPGVDEAIARRWGRLQQIGDDWWKVPGAAQTMGTIEDLQTQRGQGIEGTSAQQQSIIDALTGRLFGREGVYSQDVIQNIKDTYGSLENYINEQYGGMRGDVAKTFAGLLESGELTFGEALQEIEKLKPGGEFAQARAARSFAPMMAATAGRLRRGGIEAASPQGMGALQRVEAERARAMDDAAAAGIAEYVSAKTGLGLGRQAMRESLGTQRLGADIGLGTQQTGIQKGLRETAGQQFRGELLRTLAAQQGIDVSQAEASSQNLQQTLERNIGLLKDKEQAALLSKALHQQDWETLAGLFREMNQEELTTLGLQNMQFGAGMEYTQAKLSEQDKAMAQLMGLSDRDYARMMESARLAGGFGQQALGGYMTSYGLEAPSAGWGSKLLAGLGGSALDLLVPGLGSAVTGGGRGGLDLSKLIGLFGKKKPGQTWEDVWADATGGAYGSYSWPGSRAST